MKRLELQSQSKANFSIFCNLINLILGWNSVKGLRVTKIIKEIWKFEGVLDKLELRKGFQRQSVTKYLRLTLVFMWNNAHFFDIS